MTAQHPLLVVLDLVMEAAVVVEQHPTNYPDSGGGGNGADGNGGASAFDDRIASFAYDGWGIQGNGYAQY